MRRNGSWKKPVMILVLAFFFLQTAACGYFLYPERRGRQAGKVDPAVALMDGACCLLFLVPGIIAFAVDFSSGAIYLPAGRSSKGDDKAAIVMADPKSLDGAALEKIVRERTGIGIDIGRATVKPLQSTNEAAKALTELRQKGYRG